MRRHRAGDVITVEYVDRAGTTLSTTVTLEEDPRLELVPIESTGRTLTSAQRAFRNAWLGLRGQ